MQRRPSTKPPKQWREGVVMTRKPILPPATNVARDAGIYQEVNSCGGRKDNFVTVPERTRLPPTTKAGNRWTPVTERHTAFALEH